MLKMQCQLCKAYGGQPKEIEDDDLEEIRAHVMEHRFQTNELTLEAARVYRNWCFPNLDFGIDESDGNNSGADQIMEEDCDVGNLIGASFDGSIGAYCRHLLKDCTDQQIECAICHTRLQVVHSDSLSRRIDTAFSHAYSHLDRNIFTCRRCHHKTKTPSAMRHHLRLHHSLVFLPNYYKDRSEKYRDQVLAMLDQCYAKKCGVRPKSSHLNSGKLGKGSKSKVVRRKPTHRLAQKRVGSSSSSLGKNHCSTPISIHCMNLLKANHVIGRIQCRQCDAWVTASRTGSEHFTRPVIDHVAKYHLKKNLYRCKICKFKAPILASMTLHIHGHNVSARGNYKDRSQKYEKQMIDMLSKCFEKPVEIDGDAMVDGIFMNNTDQAGMSAQPTPMTQRIKNFTMTNNNDQPKTPTQAKPPQRRIVQYVFTMKSQDKTSCQATPATQSIAKNTITMTKYHDQKILSQARPVEPCIANITISESQDHQSVPSEAATPSKRGRKSNSISGFCLNLIKENSRKAIIKCGLCTLDVKVRDYSGYPNTRSALNHAQGVHMDIQFYQCKRCNVNAKTLSEISQHIINRHKCTCIGSYTDRSKNFEHEIMEILSKCFGKDQSIGGGSMGDSGMINDSNGMDGWIANSAIERGPSTSGLMDQSIGDGSIGNYAINDGASTSGVIDPGFIQVDGPLMWKCSKCAFATKHWKLIKNHAANHK